MVTESRTQADPASSLIVSPIENEIPAYRAVSPMAIASLVLGVFSVLSFANVWFALVGLIAIALGLLAQRRITRYPDMLTGQSLAQGGIALGLIFMLSAVTFAGVRYYKVSSGGSAFALRYGKLLAKRDMPTAAWYRLRPSARIDTEPQTAFAELTAEGDPMIVNENIGPIMLLHEAFKQKGVEFKFLGIEESGYDGLTPFAFAIFQVTPPPHDHEEGEADHAEPKPEFALVEVRSEPNTPGENWWVSAIAFPYELKSHQLSPKAVDDGHGHAH